MSIPVDSLTRASVHRYAPKGLTATIDKSFGASGFSILLRRVAPDAIQLQPLRGSQISQQIVWSASKHNPARHNKIFRTSLHVARNIEHQFGLRRRFGRTFVSSTEIILLMV